MCIFSLLSYCFYRLELGEQDRKYLLEQLVTVKRENMTLGAEVDMVEKEVLELRDRKEAMMFRPVPALRGSGTPSHKMPGVLASSDGSGIDGTAGKSGKEVTFSGVSTPGLPELQRVQLSYEISRLKSLTSIDRVKV